MDADKGYGYVVSEMQASGDGRQVGAKTGRDTGKKKWIHQKCNKLLHLSKNFYITESSLWESQFPQVCLCSVCEVRVVGTVCEKAEQTGLSAVPQTLYTCVT